MSKVYHDVSGNFDEFIGSGVTLVDFWATWCGPCRMMAPILDDLSEDMPEVKIGKVDVDDNPALAEKFKIFSIPNMCVFKDGAMVDRIVGLTQADEVAEILKKYL